MRTLWRPPALWIFLAATLLGLFSTAQSYRLTVLTAKPGYDVPVFNLLIINLALWYIPALLVFPIVGIARRLPFDGPGWWRGLIAHPIAALSMAAVHVVGIMGVRAMLGYMVKPAGVPWATFLQRQYLAGMDWALMTYAAIVGITYALTYYRESRERELKSAYLETRLVEARLKMLEAELHPHFLFNTLHAILTLVHSNPEAADRMISRLSDLLRLTFDRSGQARIALHEELEFLQKYLEIEQIRFQDRLTVQYDIEPDTLDAEVPRLILQPLVENAIKHGIGPRTEPGVIQISSRRRDDVIWLEVRDNGVGVNPSARTRLDGGVGLANTRDRLECLYGTHQQLQLSDGHGGLAVAMEIPFSRVPSEPGELIAVQVA
jgi:signal transduction histidine kinase